MNTCETNETVSCCSPTDKSTNTYAKPRYHAKEVEHGYELRVYVPGADKSGITLSLDRGVLSIVAERTKTPNETWRLVNRELPSDDYRLLLKVDNKIDPERIAARLENGVLEVTLPFQEKAKPRVIEVD